MTAPYRGIPMLEGWADQLKQPLADLGSAVANIADPKLRMQQELIKNLATHPEMSQQLIDMESQNPGTIDKVFGKQVAYLGLGAPSAGAQQSMYERDNASKPVSEIAGQNTLRSNKALTDYSANATPNLSRAQSEATKAGAEASVAPVIAQSQGAEAQASLDFNVAQAIAKAKAQAAGDQIKDKGLVDIAMQRYNKIPGGVIGAMKSGDPGIDEDTRNALFKDPGIWRQYSDARDQERLEMSNKRDNAYMQHLDNMDANRVATERATLDEQIMKHDAQTRADSINRLGFNVNPLDLYTAQKMGLQPFLDQAANLTPQQLQQALTPDPKTGQPANPQLAQLMQTQPTMLKSWQDYKQGIERLGDKDLQTQRDAFTKELARINSSVLSKATKIKGKTDPTIIQQQINDLQQMPYAQMMREKGQPVDVQLGKDSGNMFGLNKQDVLQIVQPVSQTQGRAQQIIQLIKDGKADRAKTLADPRLTAQERADIIKGLGTP